MTDYLKWHRLLVILMNAWWRYDFLPHCQCLHIFHHCHGNFMAMKADKHPCTCYIEKTVTLSAATSALYLPSSCFRSQNAEKREFILISMPVDRIVNRGIRLEKCDKQVKQTEWLPMSRSYLAGNLEEGWCLYASMWQCVRVLCQNANKATMQLLGTFTELGVNEAHK